jgi:hypothetical protein
LIQKTEDRTAVIAKEAGISEFFLPSPSEFFHQKYFSPDKPDEKSQTE